MAYLRKKANGDRVWKIQSKDWTPLSEQLEELAVIFNYESLPDTKSDTNRLLCQMLSLKAKWLAAAARKQEREMKSLKDDMEVMRETIAGLQKEIAALKDPPAIDLAKPRPPKGLEP